VYNHLATSTHGVALSGANAEASGNKVFGNLSGIRADVNALALNNEAYSNTTGITLSNGTARGNRVYSNSIGVADTGSGQIENNLVYANTNAGIVITNDRGAQTVRNNTIYQEVGDAVRVNGSNAKLYNNIIWVNSGYGVNVISGGATLKSDFNLFHTPLAGGNVGLINGTQAGSLAVWRLASGQDAGSKAGNPMFLDIDGADNVLGDKGVTTGGGSDDNFGLRAGSAAIDAGSMWTGTGLDIEGRPRRDDPSTANTGEGLPLYVGSAMGGSSFANVGTKLPLRHTDSSALVNLPFEFTFYGKTYTSVRVDVNGFLQFAGPDTGNSNSNTLDGLLRNARIAPLWDNLATNTADTSRDVYVDKSVAGQVTVRWAAVQEGTANVVNFSVTLFSDGRFRFDYGQSAAGLTPTVGVSAGNGQTYVLAAYDGQSNLSNAASLMWEPKPGLDFHDIGAYEFQGDSQDRTAPKVVSISNLPVDGGNINQRFSSLLIKFSEALDGVSARSAANYELRSAGADGLFNTADDQLIALKPGYSYPATDLTLQLVNGPLADGLYRLTLAGSLFDTAGNALDGNGDGTGGDAYVRTFSINRAAAPLQISSFTQTDSGFKLRFTEAVDAAKLNLYNGQSDAPGAASGASDLIVTGPGGALVAGSLVLDADGKGFTFVRTGGVLGEGAYSVALASRDDGVTTKIGALLDGDADGTAGGNYQKSFIVAASSAAVLGIGEVARGPGQTLAIAASGYNFPLTLDNAAGATRISFTLNYDAALLNITGLTGGTLPAGSTVDVDLTTPGQARVTIVAASVLPAGRIVLGHLQAMVPQSAPYGSSNLLTLGDAQIDNGTKPVKSDAGLHVVAYIGDASGDGGYAAVDSQRIQRVAGKQDSGFAAWPLLDPLLLGDITANGAVQASDAARLNLHLGGVVQKEIPAIPVVPVKPAAQGVSLSLDRKPSGFDLGAADGAWLDSWVAEAQAPTKKVNAWTVSAAPAAAVELRKS
ncbi:MAG: right-handed parallel beta-helix repeat-containing protein, partial [Burkholderiaceae bacterium]|nr:right-handed parallel beta-helix repeat-containing protein [Burkholderiaceae bacterium]